MRRTIMAILLAAGLLAPAVSADIYRRQDAQGHWHFSDRAPSDVTVRRIGAERSQQVEPPAAVIANTEEGGLFWRIVAPGARPSFLLGTIHVADPRVTRLRPRVEAALNHADSFTMEMIPDEEALQTIGNAMLISGHDDLESLVGGRLYSQIVEALSEYGIPDAAVRRLKPWAAMALLSSPKPSEGLILDMVLYLRALGRGIEVYGLESPQEQLTVFEALPLADQIALLTMTIEQLPILPRLFEQLISAYAADDLASIAAIAPSSENEDDRAVLNRFMFKLNDKRNRRMVQRLDHILREGNAFIAIGALHLPGPRGVLQLLRNNGFLVESIR
jgi:uncharacterized protein